MDMIRSYANYYENDYYMGIMGRAIEIIKTDKIIEDTIGIY
tara:strand:+ start:209 stop:331 length:123 start_codon:yes stop_codon:yes gene_type:complete